VVRFVALVSLLYDVAIGLALFFARPQLQAWFGVPAPVPPIHADLNALFVIFVGLGYLMPLHDATRYRAYMWIFGVGLKLAGAAVFLLDARMRGGPQSFLLFAVSDLALGLITLVALLIYRRPRTVVVPVRRGSYIRHLATLATAKLLLPFAVLRVAPRKPPVDRDPCQDDEHARA
jgi:hypothetical protein